MLLAVVFVWISQSKSTMRMKMFFIVLYRLNNMRFLPRTENLQKIYLTNLQALMDLQYIYIYIILLRWKTILVTVCNIIQWYKWYTIRIKWDESEHWRIKIKWLKINKWLKLFFYKLIEIINDYRI